MPAKAVVQKAEPSFKETKVKTNKVRSVSEVSDQGETKNPPKSRVRRVSGRYLKDANITKPNRNDNRQLTKNGTVAENNNAQISDSKRARKASDRDDKCLDGKVLKKNVTVEIKKQNKQKKILMARSNTDSVGNDLQKIEGGELVAIIKQNGGESRTEEKSELAKTLVVASVEETINIKEDPEVTETKVKSVISNSTVRNGSASQTGKMFVGGHSSGAGGIHNAVKNAVAMKAKSFALFLRSQRTWNSKPLEPDIVAAFKALCATHGYSPNHILPHGSYLVNLGSPKSELREKSFNLLKEELERCEELGLTMFNIHPGSSCGEISKEMSIEYIAAGINRVFEMTSGVKVVLENMSGQGNTIGGDFRELRAIIERIDDKTRVGVCLDTCHAMAAGYDLSKQEGFNALINCFSEQVGFEWLVGVHVNDSKGPAGCNKDRHENIGKGTIGKEGFRRIMNCEHFADLPLILETPFVSNETYEREIELLEGLIEK